MRQDWNLEYRLLEAALQVRDRVQLSHQRTQRPARSTPPVVVPSNPSWEAALREAMQPMA